jgi:L-methionine (R)-S-oxide reductase
VTELAAPYGGALKAIAQIVDGATEPDEALRAAVAALEERLPHYTWVGLYFVEGGELLLGPWAGAAASPATRLPVDKGAIGAAVTTCESQIVPDTTAVEGYAACFSWTRAEIDVPVSYDGQVVGVIGIDSDRPAAFGPDDVLFLERVGELIATHCLVGWDTGGERWAEVD